MDNSKFETSRELLNHLTEMGILKPVESKPTSNYAYLEKGFYVDPRDANGKVPF
jgi:hypothetical protein|tara:strand:- start:1355 stop:1516 length:162 start_codon:yes stop_codon:yes gene_type:complete